MWPVTWMDAIAAFESRVVAHGGMVIASVAWTLEPR